MPENHDDAIELPIHWGDDDPNLPFLVAAHMTINHDESHFYIRFYQIAPPVLHDKSQGPPESINATQVANLAIPATRITSIVKALTTNAKKFEERTGIKLDWEAKIDGDAESD